MADVHKEVVRTGGKEHVGELRRRETNLGSGAQAAFRSRGAARFDEAAEPGAIDFGASLGGVERREVEVGGLACDVARDVEDAVVERTRSILRSEHVLHVGHRRQNREAVSPSGSAVTHAEASSPLQDRPGRAEFIQADHRLRHHEAEVLLKTFVVTV